MNPFFQDWELWQKLTFVLACCIVIVFAIGLFKLSRTNRLMRRLHELDEEKRIRASEMRHCGTNSWGPDEIPFGVRAIQKGVEVEGIWISQSDTPEISQIASSTTLVANTTELGRIESRRIDPISVEARRTRHASGSIALDDTMVADILRETTQTTLVASIGEDISAKKREIKTRKISQSAPSVNRDHVTNYMPTGLLLRQPADDRTRKPMKNQAYLRADCGADVRTCLAEMPSRIPLPQRQGGGPMLYSRGGGSAYRYTRQINRNFVVVPTARVAGTALTPTKENVHKSNIEDVVNGIQGPGHNRSRLRKKPQ